MSVYKSSKSPYYCYDFQLDGRRFHGSTKAKNKREAEVVEREIRTKARADLAQAKLTGNGPLSLDLAAGRYWLERGQNLSGSADTERDLTRLIAYFGPNKRLDEITDADVAALVAWRRAQTRKGRKKDKAGNPVQLIATATVNRSTTGVLRQLFTRAKRVWRYQFSKEPNWQAHWLKEPTERVRELHDHEAAALSVSVRDDYAPWLEFARLTGLRLNETLIRWKNVNWGAGQIKTAGKGGKVVTTPITSVVKALLEPLKDHHPEFVFTFVCQRAGTNPKTGEIYCRGQRYPIRYASAKTEWRRTRDRSQVVDFRFHDIRHDTATKLLRQTGNMKLVQKALNHTDMRTTARYAHVMDGEVAAALELVANSRKKPRKTEPSVA